MPVLVPTDPESARYFQRVKLEDREYELYFDYSQYEDRWYLSIAHAGVQLVRGLKLVMGFPLGPRVANRLMFPGALVVETSNLDRSTPGWGELGQDRRCQLYYLSREELLTDA